MHSDTTMKDNHDFWMRQDEAVCEKGVQTAITLDFGECVAPLVPSKIDRFFQYSFTSIFLSLLFYLGIRGLILVYSFLSM